MLYLSRRGDEWTALHSTELPATSQIDTGCKISEFRERTGSDTHCNRSDHCANVFILKSIGSRIWRTGR